MESSGYPDDAETRRNLAVIDSWDFSVWETTDAQRIRFAMTMYASLGLIDEFRIPVDKVKRGESLPAAQRGLPPPWAGAPEFLP